MVQGQVFYGGGGLAFFLFNFFKVYYFYISILLFAKLCYAFEEKVFFLPT